MDKRQFLQDLRDVLIYRLQIEEDRYDTFAERILELAEDFKDPEAEDPEPPD